MGSAILFTAVWCIPDFSTCGGDTAEVLFSSEFAKGKLGQQNQISKYQERAMSALFIDGATTEVEICLANNRESTDGGGWQ